MSITWEAPEPSGRSFKWPELLAEVRTRPGEWANLGEHNSGYASMIKTGQLGGAEPGEFDATSRRTNQATHRSTLYVRYIGHEAVQS